MKKIILTSITLFVFLLSSCDKDGLWYNHKWEKMHPYGQNASLNCPDTAGTVSYSGKVVPILQTNCSLNSKTCHSPSSPYDLTTHAGVVYYCGGTSPNTILEQDINQTSNCISPMPQTGSKLAACDILVISQWIKQGALNN